MFRSRDVFARNHFAITPDDDNDIPQAATYKGVTIQCIADGDVVARDWKGVAITYPVVAGDILAVQVWRVDATGTTATVIGLSE